MKQHPMARKIVANLAYRYRCIKRSNVSESLPEHIQWVRDAETIQAWNAYVASQRILYGDES